MPVQQDLTPEQALLLEGLREVGLQIETSLAGRLEKIEASLLGLHVKLWSPGTPESNGNGNCNGNGNGADGHPMASTAATQACQLADFEDNEILSYRLQLPAGSVSQSESEDANGIPAHEVMFRQKSIGIGKDLEQDIHVHFEARDAWQYRSRSPMKISRQDAIKHEESMKIAVMRHSNLSLNSKKFSELMVPWWMLSPSSNRRLSWDGFGMLCILYDMVAIPFDLAFTPDETTFSRVAFWVAVLFWTLDIPMSLITGFYDHGVENLIPRRVAENYFKSWFALDISLVTADWVWVYKGMSHRGMGMARVGKTLRILRVVRSLRLIRLVKVMKFMSAFIDRIHSTFIHVLIDVWKLVAVLLGINHLVACSWYAIGTASSEESMSWIHDNHFEDGRDTGIAYRYLTSLHWSLTQFTPASMEVFPTNANERGFAVAILILALLVFSSFLSSITASMTQLRHMTSAFDKNMSLLRRFLRAREVPASLSYKVICYAEHRLRLQHKEVQEDDVRLLSLLSRPLQMELLRHTFGSTLSGHPLLAMYADMSEAAIQTLCLSGISCHEFCDDDMVFSLGHEDGKMIFLLKGVVRYIHFVREDELEYLRDPGVWCCEAALWTRWTHVGTMYADDITEILFLDVSQFVEVTLQHHSILEVAAQYGRSFVMQLNEIAKEELVSDLDQGIGVLPEIDVDLMRSMASEKAIGYRRSSSMSD